MEKTVSKRQCMSFLLSQSCKSIKCHGINYKVSSTERPYSIMWLIKCFEIRTLSIFIIPPWLLVFEGFHLNCRIHSKFHIMLAGNLLFCFNPKIINANYPFQGYNQHFVPKIKLGIYGWKRGEWKVLSRNPRRTSRRNNFQKKTTGRRGKSS